MDLNAYSGWINLDKPAHITSARLLNRLKKYLPKIKVGHAGTLDQLASGVLPVAVGEATKLIQYAQSTWKTYEFEVTWGKQTATDDSEGAPLFVSDKRPTKQEVLQLLPSFLGTIRQMPPQYSALKIDGKRSSDRIRQGEVVQLEARNIIISELTLTEHTSDFSRFAIDCGKGTYVRSLARDMGLKLGCYGYITALKRTRVGPFDLNNAVDGEKFLDQNANIDIKPHILSSDYVLGDILDITVTESQIKLLRSGQTIRINGLQNTENDTLVACKSEKNALIAMAFFQDGLLRPKRVFNI
jgi:tRNA pseudouridine55 synthase